MKETDENGSWITDWNNVTRGTDHKGISDHGYGLGGKSIFDSNVILDINGKSETPSGHTNAVLGTRGGFGGGGNSTLVDGYTVTEELKKDYPDYYKILTEVKVRYQFIDQDVVLEDWAEMIQLNENKNLKQVRFSPRLDFVPLMDKEKLDLYYAARKKISELYNSDKYRLEFKLNPGDLLMMDNYRLLHGRTTYDANEGKRFLQGCYIDYDSTEGRLKHLKRKFNI